jgi:hypothetical protein
MMRAHLNRLESGKMTKVVEYIKAYRELQDEFALGRVTFITYAVRNGMLIAGIDAERAPVADKAADLYDKADKGLARALQIWLHDQPAEVVLASGGLIIDAGHTVSAGIDPSGMLYYGQYTRAAKEFIIANSMGAFLAYPEGEPINSVEWTIFFPSGICSVEPERDSTCADAAQWLWMRGDFANLQNYLHSHKNSAEQIVGFARSEMGRLDAQRAIVADAAEFLHRYARVDQGFMRRWPTTLTQLAKLELEALNDHRVKVADAIAEILVGGLL